MVGIAWRLLIDIDPIKLEMARHNARLYSVEHKIEWVVGDFMVLAPSLQASVVFLSPPWGGPEYIHQPTFDIKHGMTPDGEEIFAAARNITPNVVYYLPRNADRQQMRRLVEGECTLVEEQVHGRTKALTAYCAGSIPTNCS